MKIVKWAARKIPHVRRLTQMLKDKIHAETLLKPSCSGDIRLCLEPWPISNTARLIPNNCKKGHASIIKEGERSLDINF